jgi:hypothetical protein
VSSARSPPDLRSDERFIPMILSRLAEKLVKEGFRPEGGRGFSD